jgi:HEAT repeat protein
LSTSLKDGRVASDLSDSDPGRRLAAIDLILSAPSEALSELLSDDTLDALIRCVGAAQKTIQRRAIDALVLASEAGDARIVERLRRALAGDDRRMRWGVAYALGQIGAGAFAMHVADALCEALSDDDGDIRWAAANLIVRLGRDYPEEIRARLIVLGADSDHNARKMALYCIRDLGFAGADLLAVLKHAVHDRDVHVRLAALAVLTRLIDASDSAATLALESLETDTDPGVRRAAAVALGNFHINSPRAASALRNAAADNTDSSLARAARGALERLEKR